MKAGTTKTRINITLDKEVHEKAKVALGELGLKVSTLCNVILKSLVESETKPMKDVYGDITEMLLKEARIRKRKKEEP